MKQITIVIFVLLTVSAVAEKKYYLFKLSTQVESITNGRRTFNNVFATMKGKYDLSEMSESKWKLVFLMSFLKRHSVVGRVSDRPNYKEYSSSSETNKALKELLKKESYNQHLQITMSSSAKAKVKKMTEMEAKGQYMKLLSIPSIPFPKK